MEVRKIIWDKNKNEVLQKIRGISFEVIAEKIQKQEIIDITNNPSKNHTNQHILIFDHQKYTWACPCLITETEIILKTAFPSRKINKTRS